jgi:hypothetical protein
MNIVYSSNRGKSAPHVLDYLKSCKIKQPGLKVVDLGGAYNPWSRDVADTFVDMNFVTGVDLIHGDLHDPAIWTELRSRKFDFCICSHTLEDVRDPLFILSEIKKSFQHGYLAMPNKHVEFSHVESPHYVGYGHHRWIYTLMDDELRVVAKFPAANFFSPRRRFVGKIMTSRPYQALKKAAERKDRIGMSDIGYLPWWDSGLADINNELAFIWQGELRFSAINGDYAGQSIQE